MERKGGCLLVPRYGSGSGVGGQAPGMSWQMGRIMLKFRPIAPKPAAMAPAPTPAPVAAAAAAVTGRGKRKAVGGGGGRRGRKPKKAATVATVPAAPVAAAAAQTAGEKESEKEKSLSSRSSSASAMTSVDSSPPSPPPATQQPATLPLMPVSPAEEKAEAPAPVEATPRAEGTQPPATPAVGPAASSWITVEDVTSTWRDGEAPSAAAAASACGADGEAPAFVSDQWGRVTWSNAAFTRAVLSDDTGEAAAARLAGALPAWGTCAGFTCRVRVRHSGPRRRGGSVVAPCDVWRLDADGCYLWRLDLQAALTLGGLP